MPYKIGPARCERPNMAVEMRKQGEESMMAIAMMKAKKLRFCSVDL
jgi:hypothetical protein